MDEITLMILKVVVSVCTALVTAFLIPFIKTLRDDKRYKQAFDIVEKAVKAAEQKYKQEEGAYKKAEVLGYVCQQMEEKGIKINPDQLDSLIECAVYQIKQE